MLQDANRIADAVANIALPRMFAVRQKFDATRLSNVEETMRARLDAFKGLNGDLRGRRIAVAVGSRGVAEIPLLTRTVVSYLTERGALPFVIPAMGSHGGATAEGQTQVLESLGVTAASTGAPIRSTMDVVEIGRLPSGLPVFMDAFAHAADGVVVINRIKPHTAFRGPYESGLAKMMAIGLGKQRGAQACHAESFARMAENVPAAARIVASTGKVLAAVGTIENAYDQVCEVHVLTPDEVFEQEPALLDKARVRMPRLYPDDIDVLIVDRIGKNISGDGMDPNITGRYPTPYARGGPDVRRIVALSLTEETHGNANGIGMADLTTRRLVDQTELEQGYMNALTSTVLDSVRLPVIMPSDRAAIQLGIATSNRLQLHDIRIVRIRDTLSLDRIFVSPALVREAKDREDLEIDGDGLVWTFDERGNLTELEGGSSS